MELDVIECLAPEMEETFTKWKAEHPSAKILDMFYSTIDKGKRGSKSGIVHCVLIRYH